MKTAILPTDNRRHLWEFDRPEPWFGTAPEAQRQGFAGLPDVEGHMVCRIQEPLRSPGKIAPSIFSHSLLVLKTRFRRQACRRMGERRTKRGAPQNPWQDYGDRLLPEFQKHLNK